MPGNYVLELLDFFGVTSAYRSADLEVPGFEQVLALRFVRRDG